MEERRSRLRTEIERLSVQQRACLELRAQGLRYREIGEIIGISTSAVGEFLRRAIERLREAFVNKGHTQHPTENDLLLFLDGELDAGGADSVRRHLDSCWTCRMHAAGIQKVIVDFARERERTSPPAAVALARS